MGNHPVRDARARAPTAPAPLEQHATRTTISLAAGEQAATLRPHSRAADEQGDGNDALDLDDMYEEESDTAALAAFEDGDGETGENGDEYYESEGHTADRMSATGDDDVDDDGANESAGEQAHVADIYAAAYGAFVTETLTSARPPSSIRGFHRGSSGNVASLLMQQQQLRGHGGSDSAVVPVEEEGVEDEDDDVVVAPRDLLLGTRGGGTSSWMYTRAPSSGSPVDAPSGALAVPLDDDDAAAGQEGHSQEVTDADTGADTINIIRRSSSRSSGGIAVAAGAPTHYYAAAAAAAGGGLEPLGLAVAAAVDAEEDETDGWAGATSRRAQQLQHGAATSSSSFQSPGMMWDFSGGGSSTPLASSRRRAGSRGSQNAPPTSRGGGGGPPLPMPPYSPPVRARSDASTQPPLSPQLGLLTSRVSHRNAAIGAARSPILSSMSPPPGSPPHTSGVYDGSGIASGGVAGKRLSWRAGGSAALATATGVDGVASAMDGVHLDDAVAASSKADGAAAAPTTSSPLLPPRSSPPMNGLPPLIGMPPRGSKSFLTMMPALPPLAVGTFNVPSNSDALMAPRRRSSSTNAEGEAAGAVSEVQMSPPLAPRRAGPAPPPLDAASVLAALDRPTLVKRYEGEMSCVLPWLYLSGAGPATDPAAVKRAGITLIVNCAADVCKNVFESRPRVATAGAGVSSTQTAAPRTGDSSTLKRRRVSVDDTDSNVAPPLPSGGASVTAPHSSADDSDGGVVDVTSGQGEAPPDAPTPMSRPRRSRHGSHASAFGTSPASAPAVALNISGVSGMSAALVQRQQQQQQQQHQAPSSGIASAVKSNLHAVAPPRHPHAIAVRAAGPFMRTSATPPFPPSPASGVGRSPLSLAPGAAAAPLATGSLAGAVPWPISYITLFLLDGLAQDIFALFHRVLSAIEETRRAGGVVLLHCQQGISRSGAFAIAYVMWATGAPFVAAHTVVRAARPVVAPNLAFLCQLLEWEHYLTGLRALRSAAATEAAAALKAGGVSAAGIPVSVPVLYRITRLPQQFFASGPLAALHDGAVASVVTRRATGQGAAQGASVLATMFTSPRATPRASPHATANPNATPRSLWMPAANFSREVSVFQVDGGASTAAPGQSPRRDAPDVRVDENVEAAPPLLTTTSRGTNSSRGDDRGGVHVPSVSGALPSPLDGVPHLLARTPTARRGPVAPVAAGAAPGRYPQRQAWPYVITLVRSDRDRSLVLPTAAVIQVRRLCARIDALDITAVALHGTAATSTPLFLHPLPQRRRRTRTPSS